MRRETSTSSSVYHWCHPMTSDSQEELYAGSTKEANVYLLGRRNLPAGPLLLRWAASVQTDGSVSAHWHYREKYLTRGLSARLDLPSGDSWQRCYVDSSLTVSLMIKSQGAWPGILPAWPGGGLAQIQTSCLTAHIFLSILICLWAADSSATDSAPFLTAATRSSGGSAEALHSNNRCFFGLVYCPVQLIKKPNYPPGRVCRATSGLWFFVEHSQSASSLRWLE